MKILIINQPLNNRGDESAHKALVRRFVKEYPNYDITVLFEKSANPDSIRQFGVKSPNIHYVHFVPAISKGFKKISEYGLKHDIHILWFLHPGILSWLKYFKNADIVICAPGGINMGGFQSWYHLFNLYCAKLFNKPIIYYGRSIGPFPTNTADNRQFKKISLKLLNYFKYISLRDKKSEQEAQKLGINYISTIDTAFLDSPCVEIPMEILKKIGDTLYFVFVPNLLIWHFAYKDKATKEDAIRFYVRLLRTVFEKYSDYKAVMLPQTFNYKSYMGDDVLFMRDIAKNFDAKKVAVIDDVYSSDIQQTVISRSAFVIGARYHSIVFAVNNSKPFIALNYEHKIEGLLETLGLKDYMVDIRNVFDGENFQNGVIRKVENLLPIKPFDLQRTQYAKDIAETGFEKFKNII